MPLSPCLRPHATPKRAGEDLPPAKKSRTAPRVTIDGEPAEAEEATFAILPSRLQKKCTNKFAAPTPIQAIAWPLLLAKKDVVGIAKTGSGKTLAFAVPFLAMSETGALERWDVASACPRMVCLAPTRELVLQIAEVVAEFAQLSKSKVKYPVVTLVGGLPKREQLKAIASGCDIACCTPGRLEDFLGEQVLDLGYTQFCVLDEADRMLDMGFRDAVKQIVGRMPNTRQTVLFSATWPESVQAFARGLMGKSVAHVTVGGGDQRPRANEAVEQVVEVMPDKAKYARLTALLKTTKAKKVLVFGLYKKECAWLHSTLQYEGYHVGCLQGDMTQDKRSATIEQFKRGTLSYLVATDVAGRGLDVEGVELVVNYTFPLTVEDYVHRIGRTGRAGKTGRAVTFFCAEGLEKPLADELVTVLRGAKQPIPEELLKIANGAGGAKATKKKAHALYGAHFKDEVEMAKLEAKKVHTTFDDSDDE